MDVLKPLYGPAHLIVFVSWLFALLGLVGFYARQAHRTGVLSLIGFAVTYHFYLLLYEAYATVSALRCHCRRRHDEPYSRAGGR